MLSWPLQHTKKKAHSARRKKSNLTVYHGKIGWGGISLTNWKVDKKKHGLLYLFGWCVTTSFNRRSENHVFSFLQNLLYFIHYHPLSLIENLKYPRKIPIRLSKYVKLHFCLLLSWGVINHFVCPSAFLFSMQWSTLRISWRMEETYLELTNGNFNIKWNGCISWLGIWYRQIVCGLLGFCL